MKLKWILMWTIVTLVVYFGCVMSRGADFAISQIHLMRGIEGYQKKLGKWPLSYLDVSPYLDAPYSIESMNPRIVPIDDRHAYLWLDDWSMLFKRKIRYRVTLDEKGHSSYIKE